jgi:hypothetical protein
MRKRELKTVTSCAQEAAQSFDAVTAWVVCVVCETDQGAKNQERDRQIGCPENR